MQSIHWYISLPLITQRTLGIQEGPVCKYTQQQIQDIGLNYHSAPNGITCEKCKAAKESLKRKG